MFRKEVIEKITGTKERRKNGGIKNWGRRYHRKQERCLVS
jgi:hypothetical protein